MNLEASSSVKSPRRILRDVSGVEILMLNCTRGGPAVTSYSPCNKNRHERWRPGAGRSGPTRREIACALLDFSNHRQSRCFGEASAKQLA